MTPEQALQILDQVAALAPVNRADQRMAVEAVQVLRGALERPTSEVTSNGDLAADVEVATE